MMRKTSLRIYRKAAAGLLMAALLVGTVITPVSVKAEVDYQGEVLYSNEYKMTEYWKEDEKKAPVKAGYVFGGWYHKEDGKYTAITKDTAQNLKESAVAKFVPAYVLSVKAQNESGTVKGHEKPVSLRVVTSVDTTDYEKMGIALSINNKRDIYVEPTNKVYTGLMVDGEETPRTAKQIFGAASEYVSVWRLDNIAKENDNKIIYVRPYWITLDGTKVEGLAKYLHVEDGYSNYISVPVNLMTGEAVAAGRLQITSHDPRFEFYDVEPGRLFTEMEYSVQNDSGAITVKLVGNVLEIDKNINADGIYANVRFKLKEGVQYETGTGEPLIFSVTGEEFCDWGERLIATIDAWDVRH